MKPKERAKRRLVDEVYTVTMTRDADTHVVFEECWSVEPVRGTHGYLHRAGGPACIYRDVTTGTVIQEEWWMNGERHREDGPALIKYAADGKISYASWYNHGKVVPHRRKGAAVAAEKPPTP